MTKKTIYLSGGSVFSQGKLRCNVDSFSGKQFLRRDFLKKEPRDGSLLFPVVSPSREFFLNAQRETVGSVIKRFVKQNEGAKAKDRIRFLHVDLCKAWRVVVGLKFEEKNYERLLVTGGSELDLNTLTIKLYLVSLVVYLHEFKHALQFFYPEYRQFENPEEDAFAWAFAVIREGFPRYYEMLKKSGFFSTSFVEYDFSSFKK